jgi:long-chain fatty acid transport protein
MPAPRQSAFIAALLACGSATPMTALADGVRLPDQDAFATGRGEAFVATADNASAIYYNPAGLTQIQGLNVRTGFYGIDLGPWYDSPSGGTFDNHKKLQFAPQFFAAYTPQDSKLSLGVGVYAPFGLGLRWPQDTGFRTQGTESQLTYLSFNPTIAYELTPKLSLGAGLTLNYAGATLRSGLVWPTQGNDQFQFKGDGWALGYTAGVLWKINDQFAFGASFRSSTSVNLEGHTQYFNNQALGQVPAFPNQRVDAETDLKFPLNVAFGLSYRPTPKWNIEADLDYTDWSSFNSVTIRQELGFGDLIPQNSTSTLNWEPAWYYKLGVTRYFDEGWHVSAGYIYAQNAVPDAHYQPLVGDCDRHYLSVGVGRNWGHWSLDASYQLGIAEPRTVTGNPTSPAGQSVDGRYQYLSHAISLTLGFSFWL